jgi:hypothetical protein
MVITLSIGGFPSGGDSLVSLGLAGFRRARRQTEDAASGDHRCAPDPTSSVAATGSAKVSGR